MKLRIYQINTQLDNDRIKFLSYREQRVITGMNMLNAKIYTKVFDGELDVDAVDDYDACEEVFRLFNTEIPNGFKGHSLSVSDVIEFVRENISAFYYVDTFGIEKVEFNYYDI